ncbi:hypothetical protein CYLTODRAFT_353483 [Cylindrobasidium torrendii FP15055 ss-10]|uniref:C2H2-type domain-containing protein n=1 Tax=Cylindrobasidium torrendii FP15055 ss-10 TaxID=1314674 RepID=A0A0D7BAR4_9AGAR|nr:hypothetical protein CYLTODRAFT_353483 [Cylindrobasidium torrendii FP15055 ss-10]
MHFTHQPQEAALHALGSTPHVPCLWGNCSQQFVDYEQLIQHVNACHLAAPPQAPIPAQDQALACMWGDCHQSLPVPPQLGPDMLFNHLLHDHFAAPSESTPSTPPLDFSGAASSSETESVLTPVEETPTPECAEVHVCQWTSCGLSFPSCDELTRHLNEAHVGGGKAHYECFWSDCQRHGERGFSSKQKICRHLQSHTGHRPFQCKLCKQNFSEAATLQQHMRRHTLEKPYTCDHPGCEKKFAIAGALTIHKRIHNGDKPFKCTYCERAFAESSNLSKHLRTHTGVRPYRCKEPGCGKAFARPDQLTRHVGTHKRPSLVKTVVA